MRAPGDLSYRVFVTEKFAERAFVGEAQVEGSNYLVDSSNGEDVWAIFIPVLSEEFGGGMGRYRDRERSGGGWGTNVEEADDGV